jgi:hypothetical protein
MAWMRITVLVGTILGIVQIVVLITLRRAA